MQEETAAIVSTPRQQSNLAVHFVRIERAQHRRRG
jgi:hypothetical protein